jgi:hypothetical protein
VEAAVLTVNRRRSLSKQSVDQNLGRGMCLALALAGGCGDQAHEPAESPLTTRTPPACHIDAPFACRVGCDAEPPKKILDVAPDLSGIDLASLHGLEITEILIDNRGAVKDVCLLRGVREDIDVRALAAIRQWRFEPTRLRHSTPPGAPVSVVMTVTLPIGR